MSLDNVSVIVKKCLEPQLFSMEKSTTMADKVGKIMFRSFLAELTSCQHAQCMHTTFHAIEWCNDLLFVKPTTAIIMRNVIVSCTCMQYLSGPRALQTV